MTSVLESVGEKVERGEALARDDAFSLWDMKDIVSLGMLADAVRRRRHGDAVTFVRVADAEVTAAAEFLVPSTAGEVRISGSGQDLEAHLDELRQLVARAADVPVTAGRLEQLVESTGRSELARLLGALKGAGILAVSSAAIDVLDSPEAAVKTVLDAGLRVERFVVARAATGCPWEILESVRALQESTGGVHAFAPLPLEQNVAQPTTGYSDVKSIALARLVLNAVPSIQVDWTHHGPKLAQVALIFGADDVDAVSTADEVGTGRRRAPLEEVQNNIKAASLRPVMRRGRRGEDCPL